MAILKQSTAYTRLFVMVLTSDHITGATGTSPIVALSKAGAILTTAAGTVAEVTGGLGWYKISLTTADTSALGDLAFHCTATACDATDFVDQVSTHNVNNDLTIDTSGNVSLTSNIKKNQALNGFTFTMTNSSTHAPQTGLTVTATRSLDGAAFASCANSVSELSSGDYIINLAATDLNANVVMLRFTAAAADDLNILIVTQP